MGQTTEVMKGVDIPGAYKFHISARNDCYFRLLNRNYEYETFTTRDRKQG